MTPAPSPYRKSHKRKKFNTISDYSKKNSRFSASLRRATQLSELREQLLSQVPHQLHRQLVGVLRDENAITLLAADSACASQFRFNAKQIQRFCIAELGINVNRVDVRVVHQRESHQPKVKPIEPSATAKRALTDLREILQ